MFEEPYDSREIGMASVRSISLDRDTWSVSDVVSKCVIMPHKLNQNFENPLPDSVLNPEDADLAIQQAYRNEFGCEIPSWDVCTLLLPPPDVLGQMCADHPVDSFLFAEIDDDFD